MRKIMSLAMTVVCLSAITAHAQKNCYMNHIVKYPGATSASIKLTSNSVIFSSSIWIGPKPDQIADQFSGSSISGYS